MGVEISGSFGHEGKTSCFLIVAEGKKKTKKEKLFPHNF